MGEGLRFAGVLRAGLSSGEVSKQASKQASNQNKHINIAKKERHKQSKQTYIKKQTNKNKQTNRARNKERNKQHRTNKHKTHTKNTHTIKRGNKQTSNQASNTTSKQSCNKSGRWLVLHEGDTAEILELGKACDLVDQHSDHDVPVRKSNGSGRNLGEEAHIQSQKPIIQGRVLQMEGGGGGSLLNARIQHCPLQRTDKKPKKKGS